MKWIAAINPANLNKLFRRGIIIYTHNSLDKSAIQIKVSNSFYEACIIEVLLRIGYTLLFGCMYRSPTQTSFSDGNNDDLNKLLQELCAKFFTHTCLYGNFNYQDINWKHQGVKTVKNSSLLRPSRTAFCSSTPRIYPALVEMIVHL